MKKEMLVGTNYLAHDSSVIYLDEEKIFPVIQNRNSPISKIDPNTYGSP